ncbi:MAG: hypothetical protein FJX77_13930, partial [Armatimonadetes bacterium]|nr:hypothetical protein [Armatimonadota bacterium]
MLSHRFRILFPVALLGVLLAGAPAPAFQRLSVITGQFTSFAAANNLLSVNTRLGPRQFRTTAATLTFLNGRQAVLGDIQLNDAVTVRFRFDNLEVARVDVTREAKGRGRIRNTTATTIELVTGNGLLTLRTDTLSRVDLDDIPLTNRTVLNGSGFSATTVYEPRGLT